MSWVFGELIGFGCLKFRFLGRVYLIVNNRISLELVYVKVERIVLCRWKVRSVIVLGTVGFRGLGSVVRDLFLFFSFGLFFVGFIFRWIFFICW